MPPSLLIPEGATEGTFNVTTTAVSRFTEVEVYVYADGISRIAYLEINPPPPALSTISLNPATVTGGSQSTGIVTLTGAPEIGGYFVNLSSDSAAATVPQSVFFNPNLGAATGAFTVTTSAVSSVTTATITASAAGVMRTAVLTMNPPGSRALDDLPQPDHRHGRLALDRYLTLYESCALGRRSRFFSRRATAAATVPASVTVPAGATSTTFAVTTSVVATTHSATITAVCGNTRTATLTVNPSPPATLIGVAPGWVLPGDTTPVLYGSNIQPGSTVTFTGPVYSLTDFTSQLCTPGGTCPASALAATVDVGGAYAAFAIPAGTSAGIYYLKVRSGAGIDSTNNQWIAVDSAQPTRPVVPPELHHWATRIYPGQVVTGTLTGDNPSGDMADYNYYYFVATAGSRVSVSMERVDTSVPWENPSSLDPEIDVIAPDGFVYENLWAADNKPAVDLNASINDAVLPQTGIYFIAAGTTRGSGQYRLTFNVTSMAPAAVGNRAIPFAGNFATLPLNAPVNTAAVMLDARGWPVAGANVTFTNQNGPGDTGTASFTPGATTTTQLDGRAVSVVRVTSTGRTRFKPTFDSSQFAQLLYRPSEEAVVRLADTYDASTDEIVIPLYRAVAKRQIKVLGAVGGGLVLQESPRTGIPTEQLATRQEERKGPFGRSPLAAGQASGSAVRGASRIQLRPLGAARQPLRDYVLRGRPRGVQRDGGLSASDQPALHRDLDGPFTLDGTGPPQRRRLHGDRHPRPSDSRRRRPAGTEHTETDPPEDRDQRLDRQRPHVSRSR